jgi:hypothetical protein
MPEEIATAPDLVDLAIKAGFDLSESETAMLKSLADAGNFDGSLAPRMGETDPAVLEQWLLSVWGADGFLDGFPASDWWTESNKAYQDHGRLYAEAPFPTVSGKLIEWLLNSPRVFSSGIYLCNIKISGAAFLVVTVDCHIALTECVFQGGCTFVGKPGGSLTFNGVYALNISITGDFSGDIHLNGLQCRNMGGRGSGGSLLINGLSGPMLFNYGRIFVPSGIGIGESKIKTVTIVGPVLAPHISVSHCEFEALSAKGDKRGEWGSCFFGHGLRVIDDLSLNGFETATISSTSIGRDLIAYDLLTGKRVVDGVRRTTETLRLDDVEIRGTLGVRISRDAYKKDVAEREAYLVFKRVRTYRYEDKFEDLEAIKQLEIEGLEYEELSDGDRVDIANRIKWLTLQPEEPFPLKSWRRFAAELRRRGLFREARGILIQSERRRRAVAHPGLNSSSWSWLLRMSTGYGWALWRIASLAALLVGSGSAVAWFAMENGLLVPTGNVSASVSFNPVVYSLDAALPIIKLGHAALWVPNGKGVHGQLAQIYFWIHIAMGWVIGTLFVIGFTSIAHRSDDK